MTTTTENKKSKATAIYKKYYSTMVYIAKGYFRDDATAEDVVAESMEKIIRNLHKISDEESPVTRGYVCTITANTARNLIKKLNNLREDGEDILDGIPDDNTVLDGIVSEERYEDILKAISELPKKESDILYLSAVMGHSNLEIADEMEMKYDAVRKDLSRARKHIEEKLGLTETLRRSRPRKPGGDNDGK